MLDLHRKALISMVKGTGACADLHAGHRCGGVSHQPLTLVAIAERFLDRAALPLRCCTYAGAIAAMRNNWRQVQALTSQA